MRSELVNALPKFFPCTLLISNSLTSLEMWKKYTLVLWTNAILRSCAYFFQIALEIMALTNNTNLTIRSLVWIGKYIPFFSHFTTVFAGCTLALYLLSSIEVYTFNSRIILNITVCVPTHCIYAIYNNL